MSNKKGFDFANSLALKSKGVALRKPLWQLSLTSPLTRGDNVLDKVKTYDWDSANENMAI